MYIFDNIQVEAEVFYVYTFFLFGAIKSFSGLKSGILDTSRIVNSLCFSFGWSADKVIHSSKLFSELNCFIIVFSVNKSMHKIIQTVMKNIYLYATGYLDVVQLLRHMLIYARSRLNDRG